MSNLITLARAKQVIPNVPSADDPIVEALIDAASDAIHVYCRRTFPLTAWDEITSGRRDGKLALRQFPIASIARIAVADRPAFLIRNEDAPLNQRATVRITATGLVLTRWAGGAAVADSSILWSAHATLQSAAAAVNALGSGWTATVADGYGPWPTADLRPLDLAKPCLKAPAEFFVHDDEKAADRIDAEAGLVFGDFPAGEGNVRVEYTAGFTAIPEAVQQACALLVAQWYAEGKHDAARRFDGLGGMQYSRFAPEGLPEAVRRLLAPWRNLTA